MPAFPFPITRVLSSGGARLFTNSAATTLSSGMLADPAEEAADSPSRNTIRSSISLCVAFAIVSGFGFHLWDFYNGNTFWRLREGGSVELPVPELAGAKALGAFALAALLLVASRVHHGRSWSWSFLFGATAGGVGWFGVLGSELGGDDFMELNGALTGLGTLAALVGTPFLVVWARRRSLEVQRDLTRLVTALAVLALLWSDATVATLQLPGAHDEWWIGSLLTAMFLSLVLVGVAPHAHGWRREPILGLLVIWSWAAVLPGVPWNDDKRMALAILGIQGETIEVVQERMANYLVTVDGQGDLPEQAHGAVRDLDLASFDPTFLQFHPGLGGCIMTFSEGLVVDVSCSYD